MNPDLFLESLISEMPELRATLSDHLIDNGTMLSHLLMADITRLAIRKATEEKPNLDFLHTLFLLLEKGLETGDARIHELVGVSFVENLIGEPKAVSRMLPFMKGKLLSEVRSIL